MSLPALLLMAVAAPLAAQEGHGYSSAQIERGEQIFFSNCARCHGPDGDSVPGINLGSGKFRHGTSDDDLIGIITKGIPGTPMPPGNFSEGDVGSIVAYLRSMASTAATASRARTSSIPGDAARGKAIFEGKGECLSCHRVNENGSFLGPDLSEIGVSRRSALLEKSLVDPSAEIRVDNRSIQAVRQDGTVLLGRFLNQDTDTLQLLDGTGKLISLRKTDLRSFDVMKTSAMPGYKEKLSGQERSDVVSYLVTLKGHATSMSGGGTPQQVSFDRLLHAAAEPQNWLTYSGTMASQRYSLLSQINTANVKNLELQWVLQTQSPAEAPGKYEATPLIVDGVMYTVQPPNVVVALDAATGRVFWTYAYAPSPTARMCCGRVNRGLAILGSTLFMGTIDGNLIALDARDGRLLWNTPLGKPEAGYSVSAAPLIVKDKVIIGPGGGEYGVNGFLAAYDPHTGKEAWRFNTIPAGPNDPGHETWAGDSWKHGSGAVWVTGSYDPELNLIYWGIGNPGPDWSGETRAGDNLYTDSVVALDADTGKLKWHFQFTPHDELDFDAVQVPVLADMNWKGSPRKLMLWGNRNGFFYVLDRVTGEFLLAKPFVKVNWASGIDAKGRPMAIKGSTPEGTLIYPNNQGGTNWYNPSYSPRTGLFYIPSWMDAWSINTSRKEEYSEGNQFLSGGAAPVFRTAPNNKRPTEEGYGAIQAVDPQTGEIKWKFDMADVTDGGVLSTATDLVFGGGREGHFYALDARTGSVLWKAALGGPIAAGPATYMANGRQYVTIAAGSAVFTFALRH
ncbi:MAG TPA: PQQ-dependent dehydrogenase, methanol/ethanol family [Bryobacteraceae bacterium]|nr:PQQ-dependent dehydrogenase, methanol/ethanol family [Bryobacteraceae bacterium]